LFMMESGDSDLRGEFWSLKSVFGDGGSEAKLTQSPVSSLPHANPSECLSLFTSEALSDSRVETSAGVPADTSTALGVSGCRCCATPLPCFLSRISLWKARTVSSLLMEQSKNS
jgi:hypothetical protein